MKSLILLLCAVSVQAADPDWPKVEATALDLLQQYIRIESVNPPIDSRKASAFFKTELEKAGLHPKLLGSSPEKMNMVVRLEGRDRTKKPLMLLNHFDVVPVDRGAWAMDPFAAVIKDGMIWGRGALDMKGIAIMHLVSIVTMKRMGVVPSRDIVMVTTCDEETNGINGIRWLIDNHWKEIDAEWVIDEGGFGSRDILAKDKLVFGIAVGEKQVAQLRLRAKGTAGHGSQPIADNANETLLRAIQKALAVPPATKQNPVVAEMLANIGGAMAVNKYTSAIQRNTISLTTLTAGVGNPPKVNVIPSTSEATLDCRLLPGVNAQEFISEVKARINDPKVTVELISSPDDPGASTTRTPVYEAVKRAILKYNPTAIVTPMLVPHGTDSVRMRMKGVPSYGVTPMILDAATAGTMHSDQERIPIAEFYKGIRIFYDVLRSEL
jgi:acetylornithine deacetylase/succinyl-diaminopimelate desuccinylase-like protein